MTRLLLTLIRFYQAVSRTVSTPFGLGSYSGCRHWPSCSDYAYTAIRDQGALRGGARSVLRFLRCNPFMTSRP